MVLFYVLGIVVIGAVLVVGLLFFLLNKETTKASESQIIPIPSTHEMLKPQEPSMPTVNEDEYKRKVEELEEELRTISDKGVAQAQEAMALVDALTKENQELKAARDQQKNEENQQFGVIQQHADQLRQDNVALQSQLDESNVKHEHLQQEALAIRKQLGDELARANGVILEFQSEKATVLAMKESNAQSLDSMTKELAEAKIVNEQLRQDVDELGLTMSKLKELNASLIEKNNLLQYELTKQHAQASGLEKICENYKIQLSRINEFQNK